MTHVRGKVKWGTCIRENLHCCRVILTVDKRQTSNLDIRYYIASMSNSHTTTKLISFPEIFVEF